MTTINHLQGHAFVKKTDDRYGIRYEEVLALECAYLRNELSKIKIALANKGISLEN